MVNAPLANRMRPKNLDEFIGQEKIIKKGCFLRKAIEADEVPSLIFWGPPGSGKTTLGFIIANLTKAEFVEFSAVTSGVKDLREVIKRAEENKRLGIKTILFIDEIHRWNKAQQDALLPHTEKGTIILIGATTENPSFSINSALISRSKVVVLDALEIENLKQILERASEEINIKPKEDILDLIAKLANGDARIALNILDQASKQVKTTPSPSLKRRGKNKSPLPEGDKTQQTSPLPEGGLRGEGDSITKELIKEIIQKPNLIYDRAGDEHYNIISAFHKSIRGGDADASVYWLARMIEAGEDPLYIARRLVRFASEDVGLANNSALLLANSVFEACHKLGFPECDVHLAHLVIYLAKSKKDITAYQAITEAKKDASELGNLDVPLHLRNAPTKLMKDLNYGKNYKYTPEVDSSNQEYFPPELKGRKYF